MRTRALWGTVLTGTLLVLPATPALSNHNASSCNLVTGTSAGESLHGTGGCDNLWAYGGIDVVRGYDGKDDVLAGPGNDTGFGGGNDDYLYGEAGNDDLDGGDGGDHLQDSGNDVDADLLCAGGGYDFLDVDEGDLSYSGSDDLVLNPDHDLAAVDTDQDGQSNDVVYEYPRFSCPF